MAEIESRILDLPVDSIAYPFGPQKIDGIFEGLISSDLGMEDLREEQETAMQNFNPEAFKYLLEVSSLYTGSSRDFRYGMSLLYRVLQDRVGNFPIPKITDSFVDNYRAMHKDHIINTYGKLKDYVDEQENPDQVKIVRDYIDEQAEREQVQRVGLFKMLEPECFDELDINIVKDSNHHIFSHPVVGGFIFSYFFFRTGLSNPANYTDPVFN